MGRVEDFKTKSLEKVINDLEDYRAVHDLKIIMNIIGQGKDLEKIKSLFTTLGNQEISIKLLEDVSNASGVKIFIGSENKLFVGTGCSLIIAPFQSSENKLGR